MRLLIPTLVLALAGTLAHAQEPDKPFVPGVRLTTPWTEAAEKAPTPSHSALAISTASAAPKHNPTLPRWFSFPQKPNHACGAASTASARASAHRRESRGRGSERLDRRRAGRGLIPAAGRRPRSRVCGRSRAEPWCSA